MDRVGAVWMPVTLDATVTVTEPATGVLSSSLSVAVISAVPIFRAVS